MIEVAIVGAGQIGSRHLQALAQLGRDARVSVVDPVAESLATARGRFEEIDSSDQIGGLAMYASVEDLPPKLDVAIVATSANVRLQVVQELLRAASVSHLVLEKVLVQRTTDLDELSSLVATVPGGVWVNCPRRMFPVYQELRDLLAAKAPLELTVEGGPWGIGCNGIHFLDLAAFLAADRLVSVDVSQIDADVHEAKRPGIKELTGTLVADFEGATRVSMTAQQDAARPLVVAIRSHDGDVEVKVHEGERRLEYLSDSPAGVVKEHAIEFPYQSALTHRVVQDLCATGRCELTPLAESISLHRPLLRALHELFAQLDPDHQLDYVPVT